MPELPEVETIRRSLLFLKGRQTGEVWLSKLAPVEKSSPKQIRTVLSDDTLCDLPRKGKYLLLRSARGAVVLHLGMSGRLNFFPDAKAPHEAHTHLEIFFTDGSSLRFVDPRRFGTLSVSFHEEGQDNAFLQKLGPDYDDPRLGEAEYFARCRKHPGLSLKALTLHQGVAAGLGNIYACEALFDAGLSPKRLVKRSKDADLARLLQSARKVLAVGIQHGGSSIRDYFDGLGNRGVMKEYLQVYDREGLKSLDGRALVKRIVQNARSTWFCPELQK